jgi:hypothetical protein
MMKKIVLKSVLLLGLVTTVQADEKSYRDGVYVGVEGSFLSFGGNDLRMETVTGGKSSNKTTYRDVTNTPISLKLGYQHYRGNRIEIYAKYGELDTDGGDISVDTYGINYEFGFASLATGSKLMPYILVGAGAGEAESSKLQKMDGSDIVEINLGLGFHYQIQENIYASFGYANNTMIFTDVKGSNDQNFEFSDTTTNTLYVGVGYHF